MREISYTAILFCEEGACRHTVETASGHHKVARLNMQHARFWRRDFSLSATCYCQNIHYLAFNSTRINGRAHTGGECAQSSYSTHRRKREPFSPRQPGQSLSDSPVNYCPLTDLTSPVNAAAHRFTTHMSSKIIHCAEA